MAVLDDFAGMARTARVAREGVLNAGAPDPFAFRLTGLPEVFGIIKPQAASRKPQAASRKPQAASRKPQAASRKPQAASRKPQAASRKPQAVLRPGRGHEPTRRVTGPLPSAGLCA